MQHHPFVKILLASLVAVVVRRQLPHVTAKP